MTSLRELPIGKTATIRSVGGEGALRQHFLDMGLIPKRSYHGEICTNGRSYGITYS